MGKYKIIEVKDDPEDRWIMDYEYNWGIEQMQEGVNLRLSPLISLEDYADFCDGQAQSFNNHEYVGSHRILAALLYRKLGREQATIIMKEIAEYGGLDGMSGVGGKEGAWSDFGIKDCWEDWRLP